jgi:hypothetical protein
MNKQISVALGILLIALATAGFTYSHWIDSATVRTTVNMAHLSIIIQNQNTTLTWTMSPDNHTLELDGLITAGQTLWTGIIVKDNGTTPVSITYGITTNNPSIWATYFTHTEYFYGPYAANPPASVWNSAPTLPPAGGSSSPPGLLAGNKLVAWQSITLDISGEGTFTTIEITVAYTATWSTWTDTVYVIYTLSSPP